MPILGREVWLRPGTSDDQVFRDTQWHGGYHVPPSSMTPPASVLDCGANIGLTAAHYKTLWPAARVVAVEMDEACAELARRNAPGVEVRCHAVSGEGGWGSYDPAVRAEAFTFRAGKREGSIVLSDTLREVILREFGETGVDFVKADIEGEEFTLFEHGNWAPLVRNLLVELHPHGDLPDDSDWLVGTAVGALGRLGYRVTRHTPHPRSVFASRAEG